MTWMVKLMFYITAFVLSIAAGNDVFPTIFLALLGRWYILYWLIAWSDVVPWVRTHWM